MNLVLDASMALAWLFDDERSPAADRVLGLVAEGGAAVPSLWPLEIANALRSATRRGRCDEAFADRSLSELGGLGIAIDPETARRAWTDLQGLSRAEAITIYDAAYLELALRLACPLASADLALLAAARRRGLKVLTA